MIKLNRKLASLVSALISVVMVLGFARPSFASQSNTDDTASSVVADIVKLAGPTNNEDAPAFADLLMAPEVNGVEPDERNGFTVWPDAQPGVSYAARTVYGGVQQFVDINSASAPTTFTYHLKHGFTVKPGPNGSALIYGPDDKLSHVAPMPWANDAQGKFVPAHFVFNTDGTTLTKVVEHHRAGVSYPVVADPILIYIVIAGAIMLTKCVINGGWEAGQLKGRKWYVVLWRVTWVCVTP